MKFATAINCMDGRVQLPVINYIKKEYKKEFIDMITEPGPNKILSENKDSCIIESIQKRLDISINNHGSDLVAVVGHYDCAANTLGDEAQKKQIIIASKLVASWYSKIDVIGLWVDCNWTVEKIY
ncbi:MAG: hypothetical protein PQJ46_16520 [Spirochaetales bacterium]|nr:hypothetical protein [Spirochaetales bacterium]